MIICAACGSQQSSVKDSRPRDDGCIRRRRACDDCGHKWTTVEVELSSYQASLDQESLEAMRVANRALKVAFNRMSKIEAFAQQIKDRERKPYKPRRPKEAA